MRFNPHVYQQQQEQEEQRHATQHNTHTHLPVPPKKTTMVGFLRRAAHFRPLRAAAFAPPTATVVVAAPRTSARSGVGDHRAFGRRERLVDGAVGHDDVEQKEPPQIELGRERERTVGEFGSKVKAGR